MRAIEFFFEVPYNLLRCLPDVSEIGGTFRHWLEVGTWSQIFGVQAPFGTFLSMPPIYDTTGTHLHKI